MKNIFIHRVPDNFISLLKIKIWPGETHHQKKVNLILKFPDLFDRCRKEWSLSELNDSSLLSSLGWESFKEKVAYSFLKEKYPSYSQDAYMQKVQKFNRLNDSYISYISGGYSRLFLLFFCFELQGYDFFNYFEFNKINKYLNKLTKKIILIDWIILILDFYLKRVKQDVVNGCFKKNCHYEILFNELNEKQRDEFNLYIYEYSKMIQDDSFYIDYVKDYA